MKILVVDDDVMMLDLVCACASGRGYALTRAASFDEAAEAIEREPFAAAIVDLHLGEASGLEVVRRVQQRNAGAEAIVISADGCLKSALESYALNVFAFVPKPADANTVIDTLARALERRRIALENTRMLWELQLLNVAGEIMSSSLELKHMLERTLAHVVPALHASWAMVRLRRAGGASVARPIACHNISEHVLDDLKACGAGPSACDSAITSREVVRWDDAIEQMPGAARVLESTRTRALMAVPISSGGEVIGALAIGAAEPGRFTIDDERVMLTLARQLGVAIAKADLYGHVHRAKAEWERTFDSIGDAIAVYDAEGRIVRANRALLDTHQWSWESLQGRTCSDAGFCGSGSGACAVTVAASRQVDVRSQVTMPDGRTFEVTTFPVGGRGGERTAVVQVAKDVTERIAAAARIEAMRLQLLQAEKLSALGQLVAGVAHELNNPLTSVIGYSQLVQEELKSRLSKDAGGAEWLTRLDSDVSLVLTEAERAARIVRNLLAFARQQSAERRPSDIAAAVESALSLREYNMRQRGITVTFDAAPGLPEVVCDTSQIQQVIVNLVLNAERAMRDVVAPSLTVTLRHDDAAGAVRIDVTDTGHGIEQSVLPRIFDPFYTTRPVGEGTGLGLSICYGIVREHGGAIWATSTAGQPTHFTLLLPAFDRAAFDRPVFIAHGDASMRAHLVSMFSAWGHHAAGAATARDAAHVLRTLEPAVAIVDRTVLDAEPEAWQQLLTSLGDAHIVLDAHYDLRALRGAVTHRKQLV
jgi:two-component system, NtrC family, sensor kinase